MEKITILGAGESGVGAAIFAKRMGYDVIVSDYGTIKPNFKEELDNYQIAFEEGVHSENLLDGVSLVIKSPGVPNYSDIICRVNEKNIPIEGDIEFAGKFFKGKTICITGSNGKTTTTSLIYHILKKAGINVGVGGNCGHSFARQIMDNAYDWFVLELSSFQLEDMHNFKADISLLLNITPDHLDRYDYQMSKYIDAKFRIIQNQGSEDLFIYCCENENITNRLSSMAINVPQFIYGLQKHSSDDCAYMEEDIVQVIFKGHCFSIHKSMLTIKGKHNSLNVMAAIAASMQLGIPASDIEEGIKTFTPVRHRLELCRVLNGVKYINDSKATNIDATKYALDAFEQPIVWIVGGQDKGNDYSTLNVLVKDKVKSIICLGKDNSKIVRAFKSFHIHLVETNKMEDAVNKAYEFSSDGDIVLLSPCCASFDLFNDFIDRGDQFKKCVGKL